MKLFVEPNVDFRNSDDGNGWKISLGCSGHRANLKIGNVSVGFDGRNICDEDNGGRPYLELGEYTDDPVRLGDKSIEGGDDIAHKLMFALCADLGYLAIHKDRLG